MGSWDSVGTVGVYETNEPYEIVNQQDGYLIYDMHLDRNYIDSNCNSLEAEMKGRVKFEAEPWPSW